MSSIFLYGTRITRDYQVDIIAYVLPGDLNNTKPPVTIVSFLKIYLRPELLTDEQRIQILHDVMRKF